MFQLFIEQRYTKDILDHDTVAFLPKRLLVS